MRKFNFLDDEKVKREKKEKSKLVIVHLYFITFFFFAHLYSNVSSGLLNYQDSRCITFSTSSSATERSIEKLSIPSSKTSVSAGHSALQNAGTENGIRRKKIRLWSTLVSSTSKMIHVIEKKILPPFEERSMEKENFWLNDDLHGLPLLLLNNSSSTKKNEAPLFNANFCTQNSDKVFSTRTVISQHSNRRFRHQTLQLHHQRRQLYKREEEWFQNFPAVKKNFEHDRQHVNNVTGVATSESEDFER